MFCRLLLPIGHNLFRWTYPLSLRACVLLLVWVRVCVRLSFPRQFGAHRV